MSGRLIMSALIAALASSGSLAADGSALQQEINACHAIGDRDTRIACYDRLAEPASSVLQMRATPQASGAARGESDGCSRPAR